MAPVLPFSGAGFGNPFKLICQNSLAFLFPFRSAGDGMLVPFQKTSTGDCQFETLSFVPQQNRRGGVNIYRISQNGRHFEYFGEDACNNVCEVASDVFTSCSRDLGAAKRLTFELFAYLSLHRDRAGRRTTRDAEPLLRPPSMLEKQPATQCVARVRPRFIFEGPGGLTKFPDTLDSSIGQALLSE